MPTIQLKSGGNARYGAILDRNAIKKFGNFLRSMREHRGMTQKDVAYKLGLRQQISISDWELGRYAPSVPEVFYGLIDIFTMTNDELEKFYDLGDDVMKKALRNDERVQKMLELRKLGMTNKQIAQEIGCGVSTVYDNIGKRSMDVRKAAEQNKPCPIPESKPEMPVAVTITTIAPKEEPKPEPKPEVKPEPEVKTGRSWDEVKEAMKSVPAMEPKPRRIGNLTIRKEVRILDLDGTACNYRVNTGTGEVELVSFEDRASLIEGILDKSTIDAVIGELQSVRTLL